MIRIGQYNMLPNISQVLLIIMGAYYVRLAVHKITDSVPPGEPAAGPTREHGAGSLRNGDREKIGSRLLWLIGGIQLDWRGKDSRNVEY